MKKSALYGLIAAVFLLNKNDLIAQVWSQITDFAGPGRYFASAFVIGNRGYVGLGSDNNLVFKSDFWEYDPQTDSWTQKADYGGGPAEESVGFSINGKGYFASYGPTHHFWEYDPQNDSWIQRADYPGAIVGSASFSIGSKGYIVTGSYSRLLWEYDGDTASSTYDTWTQKAPFPPAAGRYAGVAFSIGKKGYLGTGTNGNTYQKDLWEWDGDTASTTYNTWSQKAPMPGVPRAQAVGFSIGNKGYIGTGLDIDANINLNDLWEWDQATDTWTQMPDLPGPGRQAAVAFSIGNLGYIGTGYGGYLQPNLIDFWEFCDTCYVSTPEWIPSSSFDIRPNPASSNVYLRNKFAKGISSVEVMNYSGILVYSCRMTNEMELDVSGFSSGLYFLRVTSAKETYSTKLIIER
jgi:N-acetylneuraminic acid mutarotase